MSIVGFNFTNIVVDRKGPVQGTIDISNNVIITNIEKADLSLGETKQDGIKFKYKFTSKYSPEVGEMVFIGEVLYIEDKDKVKGILHDWEKDKKIPNEIMTNVLNTVLEKCNIQALILARDVNLPAPIQLPKINPTHTYKADKPEQGQDMHKKPKK
ncbi:MAG: hypothetical protein Q8O89_01300 [Nanoarchaeota archaeon]|nr:hypothetical protein [Nanoarchaeota archaeon]